MLAKRGIDLTSWRYSWIGAEPVYLKHLKAFEETMQPFGLQDNVLQPSYGLAEAVVAVSFNPTGKAYSCLSISADALHSQGLIKPTKIGEPNSLTLVANGTPIDGISVSIRRENGELASDNEQGQVWIAGDSITKGYLGGADIDRFIGDWFDTGDLGFIHKDELYISGRTKDLIISRGVNISPAYVEFVVERHLDLRPGKVVAFSDQNIQQGTEEVIIVIGVQVSKEQHATIVREILSVIISEIGLQVDQVIFTSASNIPKTTSGKVQRAVTKQLYLDNILRI